MYTLTATIEQKFSSFDEVLSFTAEEKKALVRIPIKALWARGARFNEDYSLGSGSTKFAFNAPGLSALSGLVGVSDILLRKLNHPGLASDVLNDLMSSAMAQQSRAEVAQLIVDERKNAIIGIVSEKYVGYSNDRFLRDIATALDPANASALFPDTGKFTFSEAYTINSRLFLRLKSRTVQGVIKGCDGEKDDVSEIGIQATNTMAGGHAVTVSWFIYRLLCSNGLIAPVSSFNGKVVHAGSEHSFEARLKRTIEAAIGGVSKAKQMVENLGSIEFSAAKLAETTDPELIFSIVADTDLRQATKEKTCSGEYAHLKHDERIQAQLADQIKAIPACIGDAEARTVFNSSFRRNASMYDFINIFTAHAKNAEMSKQIEVQTRAGVLADWISRNKRKFS